MCVGVLVRLVIFLDGFIVCLLWDVVLCLGWVFLFVWFGVYVMFLVLVWIFCIVVDLGLNLIVGGLLGFWCWCVFFVGCLGLVYKVILSDVFLILFNFDVVVVFCLECICV